MDDQYSKNKYVEEDTINLREILENILDIEINTSLRDNSSSNRLSISQIQSSHI